MPCHKGLPILGHLLLWRKDPLKFLRESAECGDIVRVQLVEKLYLLVHPDYVKRVLQENHKNYKKDFAYSRMKLLFGDGLLTSDGPTWLIQRRLIQPLFYRKNLVGFTSAMISRTTQMLERWQLASKTGQVIDVVEEMERVTLAILGDSIFSMDLLKGAEQVGAATIESGKLIMERITALMPFPLWIPTKRNRRLRQSTAVLNNAVENVIRERRVSGKRTDDLLSVLLDARDEESGKSMSDTQIRDEVFTFLQAGHQTVVAALSWTWYLLALHPEVEQKLFEEVKQVLNGRTPTFEDVEKLQYTSMVIQEAMRLYPPAWVLVRTAVDNDEIGGYLIPKGSTVMVSQYVTHRHPDFWDEPEKFDPERFSSARSKDRPRFAYFPFGAGPRQCIGNYFALLEIPLILSMAIQNYRLHLDPNHSVVPQCGLNLEPQNGIRCTVHKRDRSDVSRVASLP